jgi:hypothetical protein
MRFKVLLVVIVVCFWNHLFGQNLNHSKPVGDTLNFAYSKLENPQYRRVRVALNYSSANTMLGKRDSIPIPIFTPTFKYTTAKDFFYQFSLVHSNTTNIVFDELDLKVGKNFYVGDKWNFTVSYARYIFNKQVDRLSAVVNNDLNVYAGFDWGHELYTGLSLDFTSGKKRVPYQTIDSLFNKKQNKYVLFDNSGYTYIQAKDFTMTWMNSVTFYYYDLLFQEDRLIVTPEIDVIFGTQNGVETNASTKKLLKGNGKLSKSTSTTVRSNTPFLAYTFNLDFRYVFKRFALNLSPYYTIPQNIVSGAKNNPYFVFYGGLIYTLKWEYKKN